MTVNVRTGAQVFQALSEMLNDWNITTSTDDGATAGTSVIASGLSKYGDDKLVGRWLRQRTNGYPARRIAGNAQSSGTAQLAEPFAAQVLSGVTFETHRYDPLLKWRALDDARLEVMNDIFRIVLDDTLTSDGQSRVFPIPSTVVQGPHLVTIERPVPVSNLTWNYLTSPEGRVATGWTASNMTVSTYARTFEDLMVPKYELACQKFTVAANVNGTQAQPVANMTNDITAAKAAGRAVAFDRWVYCTVASKVALKVTDDAGTTTGATHQGRGWELLTVERIISPTNTTLLTCTMDVANSADAVAGYYERSWFYFGTKERVADAPYSQVEPFTPRIDATQQHIILASEVNRGYQLRLQGRGPLSALGTDPDAQMTAVMELTEGTEKVLAARAAELMLEQGALLSEDAPMIAVKINAIKGRDKRLTEQWNDKTERPAFHSPYMH